MRVGARARARGRVDGEGEGLGLGTSRALGHWRIAALGHWGIGAIAARARARAMVRVGVRVRSSRADQHTKGSESLRFIRSTETHMIVHLNALKYAPNEGSEDFDVIDIQTCIS